MRARLALAAANQPVALREVVLRDKPQAFLDVSPKGTVPCLVTGQGVVEESLDIMRWALRLHDPDGWLDMPQAGWDWIARADGPFKAALDRTKYATRYPDSDPQTARTEAAAFLCTLDTQLGAWVFDQETIADYAILPFVRQFAFIDKPWFDAQPWPDLHHWLDRFLTSDAFARIMPKYAQWHEGDADVIFP